METKTIDLTERNEDERLAEELDENELSYLLASPECDGEFYH